MKNTLQFIGTLFLFLILSLAVPTTAAQDLPANTEVDIEVSINYSIYGDIFAVSGNSIWNSTQFDYRGFTTGNPFLQGNFTFLANDTRGNVGEFRFAAAGAIPLPVIQDDSTLYTLHLTTKEVSDVYNIEHSFEFNEGISAVRIKTGRIVENTSNEIPDYITRSIHVYPNPTTNNMATLRFEAFVNRVDIEVYDAQGRLVYRKNTNALPGTNEVRLRSSDMAKGLNLVRVVGGGQQLTTQFINN